MKLTCLRSGTTWTMSPHSSTPRPPAPPAQCSTVPPGKCPPQRGQRQSGRRAPWLALPELDRRIGAHYPFRVGGVQVDGHAAEGPAPLDHRRVVVRVRDGDRGRIRRWPRPPAACRRPASGDAVPQDCCRRGTQEQRPLADGERRLGADPGQSSPASSWRGVLVRDRRAAHRGWSTTGPRFRDVLAFVGADRAALRS